MSWKQINPKELNSNVFKLIGDEWMLITAGNVDNYNTMTASWGGMGVIWNRNVVWCVVRPTRYTYEFTESNDFFTLSFFDKKYQDALMLCGTKSGRDGDKVAEAGLTPVEGTTPNTTIFSQANLVMECKKIYTHDIDPSRFIEPEIDSMYSENDYHRMYVGEIIYCAVKTD